MVVRRTRLGVVVRLTKVLLSTIGVLSFIGNVKSAFVCRAADPDDRVRTVAHRYRPGENDRRSSWNNRICREVGRFALPVQSRWVNWVKLWWDDQRMTGR
jgi:hypothetical protein